MSRVCGPPRACVPRARRSRVKKEDARIRVARAGARADDRARAWILIRDCIHWRVECDFPHRITPRYRIQHVASTNACTTRLAGQPYDNQHGARPLV
jgi:hypothetical protein